MLACDTFTRLEHLTAKFENAAGIKLNDGVARTRWDEAVRRYWVMKSMDDLCCGLKPSGSGAKDKEKERERGMGVALGMADGEVKMEDGEGDGGEGGMKRKNGEIMIGVRREGADVRSEGFRRASASCACASGSCGHAFAECRRRGRMEEVEPETERSGLGGTVR